MDPKDLLRIYPDLTPVRTVKKVYGCYRGYSVRGTGRGGERVERVRGPTRGDSGTERNRSIGVPRLRISLLCPSVNGEEYEPDRGVL